MKWKVAGINYHVTQNYWIVFKKNWKQKWANWFQEFSMFKYENDFANIILTSCPLVRYLCNFPLAWDDLYYFQIRKSDLDTTLDLHMHLGAIAKLFTSPKKNADTKRSLGRFSQLVHLILECLQKRASLIPYWIV